MKIFSFFIVLLALIFSFDFVLAVDPTNAPLLYNGDVAYLGYFNIPQVVFGSDPQSFSSGGMGLAVSADGTELYVGGHVYNQSLGRVRIPSQFGGNATVLQTPVTVPGSIGMEGSAPELSGALVYNGRLIVQKRIYYDNDGNRPTHAVGNLNISGFSSFTKLANIPSAQFANGYMGIIPVEWRSFLGGPAFAGNSAMSIISMCSNGPSFYVFNPDDVGVISPIPSIPLMYFTLSNPLADGYTINNYFSLADQYNAGMVFPSGTRSVLFFSRHGYGPHTYKQDDGGCGGEQGEGAAPYRRQITAFDANDLLAVKNGTKQPYSIRPYAWWTLPGPTDTCSKFAYSGLAYDPNTRRVYIAFDYGEQPRIHVYQVAEGTPAVCGDGTCNGNETCSVCAQDCGVCDTQAPTVPANLSANALSYNQINLTWTSSSDNKGVVGYKIYRNGAQIGVSASINYSDGGLSGSTAYNYRVSAYDASGNESSQSNQAQATTLIAPVIIGHDSIGASVDSSNANYINATRFIAPQNGNIFSISIYVASPISLSPNNQFQVAVYSDNSGLPGNLISQSQNGILTGDAWNTLSVSATLQGGYAYWLAYNTNAANNTSNNSKYDSGGASQTVWRAQTFGAWPSVFGTPAGSSATKTSIYAIYGVSNDELAPNAPGGLNVK